MDLPFLFFLLSPALLQSTTMTGETILIVQRLLFPLVTDFRAYIRFANSQQCLFPYLSRTRNYSYDFCHQYCVCFWSSRLHYLATTEYQTQISCMKQLDATDRRFSAIQVLLVIPLWADTPTRTTVPLQLTDVSLHRPQCRILSWQSCFHFFQLNAAYNGGDQRQSWRSKTHDDKVRLTWTERPLDLKRTWTAIRCLHVSRRLHLLTFLAEKCWCQMRFLVSC